MSVNKVIIIGNLGRDPEIRHSPDGAAVCNLSVATSYQWKDRSTGERRENTEWHRIVLFGRLAEIAGEYLRKGRPVYIEGRLQTRKWQDKETGQDRYSTEIVAEQMQMLGGRDDGQAPKDDFSSPIPQRQQRPPETRQNSYEEATGGRAGSMADLDDDVPF